MCIYRGTELFMTTWWPGTFEKERSRNFKSNQFAFTKANSNLLRCLYRWNKELQEMDILKDYTSTRSSRRKFASTMLQYAAFTTAARNL